MESMEFKCREYLSNVNKYFCKDSEIRIKNSLFFSKIGEYIIDAIKCDDYSKMLNKAMRIAELIVLFQPFYDGNNHTALVVFGNILDKKGYNFDYINALSAMDNYYLIIPCIHEEDDNIPFPEEWNVYIKR